MSCEETLEWLDAYVDAEVTPERRSALEAHLGSCAACTAELGQLRRLRDLLDEGLDATGAGLSPSFDRLWERCAGLEPGIALGTGRRAGRRRRRRLLVPVAAGALAAGAALAVSWWRAPAPGVDAGGAGPDRVAATEPPADLRRRAALFVDYGIVRRLDELEHLDVVLEGPAPQRDHGGRSS